MNNQPQERNTTYRFVKASEINEIISGQDYAAQRVNHSRFINVRYSDKDNLFHDIEGNVWCHDDLFLFVEIELPSIDTVDINLLEAAKGVIENTTDTYKAGNGKQCYIEDQHGEKMYIVPFDDIERLKSVIESPHQFERKWKWDIHFSTLFDSIETMDEFFKELMKQMNAVTNNSQFEILKVDGTPITFTALPVPDKFKPRTRPGSTRPRPMPRIPDPITYTLRFEKFEEPTEETKPVVSAEGEYELIKDLRNAVSCVHHLLAVCTDDNLPKPEWVRIRKQYTEFLKPYLDKGDAYLQNKTVP